LYVSEDKIHWARNHFQKIMLEIELLQEDLENGSQMVDVKKKVDLLVKLGAEYVDFLRDITTPGSV
jgi:hypothetical protein